MTKRDFFKIIIKLFGLTSFITSVIAVFPAYFAYGLAGVDARTISIMIITLLIALTVFALLIFRADGVVDFLSLDKGFDDDRIDFKNLTTTHLLQVGIIIIGGLLFLDNISSVISQAYFALRTDLSGQIFNQDSKINLAISALNLIVGILLLTNHLRVAQFFNNMQQKE